MAGIPKGRRVGRAAVNAVRALFEQYDHIVQEIDGQNDFGEDLILTFSEDGRTTGDVVKIQVKGGASWCRANGYSIPVEQHGDVWSDGNLPVLCVVFDPKTCSLYWANATEQLRSARCAGASLSRIGISSSAKLDESTLDAFVAEVRRYVGRYRGGQAVRTHLGEMAGVDFDPSDQVLHFVNEYGEDLIFWQVKGEDHATLLHSDLDWEPRLITPDSLRFTGGLTERIGAEIPKGLRSLADVPNVGDMILNLPEALWLAACFSATNWARDFMDDDGFEDDEGSEHACAEAEVADDYVIEQILDRLEIEPELMARSIEALRNVADFDVNSLNELGALESDPAVVAEVTSLSRASVESASFEALRLAIFYLIDRVSIGVPSLPLVEQIRIVWRVPESDAPNVT